LKRTWAIGWLFHTAAFLALVGGPAPATGDPDAPAIVEEVPAETRPAPCPSRWRGFLGRYGPEDGGLLLRERDGRLEALFSAGAPEPLDEVEAGVLQFIGRGPHHGRSLALVFESPGVVEGAVLDGETLRRHRVELEGSVFRIAPRRAVQELVRRARAATPPVEAGPFRETDLVDLTALSPDLRLDMRYATAENFLGSPVYPSARALLQRPAAEALVRAHRALGPRGYGLLIHDAYRPWWVTKVFWDATPLDQRDFVARPDRGSRHNRGAAVDLTLYRLEDGRAVEMPGVYDEMSERSHRDYPGGTSVERWHRDLLRAAMEAEGFVAFEVEWWHFDFRGWRDYPVLNVPLDAVHPAR
jgi:D-alanyl-D-alanine dipeptidase